MPGANVTGTVANATLADTVKIYDVANAAFTTANTSVVLSRQRSVDAGNASTTELGIDNTGLIWNKDADTLFAGTSGTTYISGNGLIRATSHITAGGNVVATANIYAGGNITANVNVYGQVLQFSNQSRGTASRIILDDNDGSIVATGNIQGSKFLGTSANLTGNIDASVFNGTRISVTGNANASVVNATTANVNTINATTFNVGNIIASGNVNANWIDSSYIKSYYNISTTVGNVVAGNIAMGNDAIFSTHSIINIDPSNDNAGNGQINLKGNVTSFGSLIDFRTTANVSLGAVGNIKILGGSSGNVLTTDGTGNLSWSSAGSSYGDSNVAAYLPTYTGNLSGGNITVTGNANASIFNGTTANITTVNATTLNGAVPGANVTGTVANATYALTSGVSNSVAGANVTGTVANATYALTSGVSNSVAGANVTGTVANATYALTSGAVVNGTSNVSIVTANGNVTINAGSSKSWKFDTTGNLTVPANAMVNSTTGDITIEANQIIQGLRVNGESDVTALPASSQTGWYFNNQWNLQSVTPGIWTTGGSTTDSLDFYFLVPTSATSGSNVVVIDTLGVESVQLGPLTWDAGNAALLVGQGISVFDLDVVTTIPSSTIFAAGATITSANVAAGTITISSNALKSSTNFAINAGTLVSDSAHGFYQLVGDTLAAGTIDVWDPPIVTSTTGLLTGFGGPFTGNTTAGSALTYTPSKTWSVYPELRDAATPGGLRAIDVNNVPGSVMSYTRYNNPIVIGADSTGNGAGFPTTTGRADTSLTFQGVSLISTGLDTRRNGDITTGNATGSLPKMALNFVTYETADASANVVTQRHNREKQGSLISTVEGAGNILTDNANLYVRGNVSLGSIRWGGLAGNVGPSSANPNPVAPQAGMYVRAETDFANSAITPTGVYLQYTPADQGIGYPRTFLRAVNNTTTINGTSVSLKPLANKAPITLLASASLSEANRRNYLRELNSTQDQVFLNASYYSGGNANAQGSGTTVQVRSDARVGNVALQIGRNAISTMAAAWTAGYRTTLGQYISSGANYYEATATNGTSNNFFRLSTSTAPTHTTGNVLNGNTYLVWVGNTAAEGGGSYEFIMKDQETALTLFDKTNTANIATFNNSRAAFAVPVQFPVYTAAGKPASGVVGQQIAISDSAQGSNPNGMMAFWDTTHSRWSYIHDNGAV